MATGVMPPGPKAHPILGNLPELKRDRLGFMLRCAREYGDLVTYRFGPRSVVLLSHPDDIERVLVTANRNFIKHFALRSNQRVLGNGLLTSEGEFWLRQRRLAQPAFHRQRVAAYGEVMVAYAERMLAGWADGETRDIHREMMRLTLEIVAKTLFDADVTRAAPDVGAAMELLLERFTERINSFPPLPENLPTPANRRLEAAIQRLDSIIYRFIAERRASGEDRGDLLSMLLQARDEGDGSRMTDQQLRDEAMTLVLAGHETTAIALSWTWWLLAQHPAVETKLVEELRGVLGGRPPTVEDLPRLAYTERVVMESMRLYPPAWVVGREALDAFELHGYRFPAGQTVTMSQWIVHRDPRFYDRPETFDPDRWAGGLARRLPKFAYFPFGGGPRLCIGNAFAMMEATLLLATIARRYRLELLPGQAIVPWPSITLRPKSGIRVRLGRR